MSDHHISESDVTGAWLAYSFAKHVSSKSHGYSNPSASFGQELFGYSIGLATMCYFAAFAGLCSIKYFWYVVLFQILGVILWNTVAYLYKDSYNRQGEKYLDDVARKEQQKKQERKMAMIKEAKEAQQEIDRQKKALNEVVYKNRVKKW